MSKAFDTKLCVASLEAYKLENEDLKNTISEKDKEIAELKAKLYSGKDCHTFKEWKQSRSKALQAYVEAMLAAYCMETDIPPDQVLLHTAITNDGNAHIYYWFEPKDSEDNKDLKTAQTFAAF